MKKTALAIIPILIIALSTATWFVHNQFTALQTQIIALQTQNSELQNQNNDLQSQLSELQNQNSEQQDRLADFTHQLALARHLHVRITAFTWLGDFNPIGGLLIGHSVNVTIQNDDVVPVSGLTLTAILVNKVTGAAIGDPGFTKIDRLNAGESRVVTGWIYATLGTSLNDSLCVTTLTAGDVILDQWTQGI